MPEKNDDEGRFGSYDCDRYGEDDDTSYRNDEPEMNWPALLLLFACAATAVAIILKLSGVVA